MLSRSQTQKFYRLKPIGISHMKMRSRNFEWKHIWICTYRLQSYSCFRSRRGKKETSFSTQCHIFHALFRCASRSASCRKSSQVFNFRPSICVIVSWGRYTGIFDSHTLLAWMNSGLAYMFPKASKIMSCSVKSKAVMAGMFAANWLRNSCSEILLYRTGML